MSASRELTDRLRVAADLREPHSELSVILREVADGITVQDPSGALVYANDAAARQIGFETAQQLLATPITEVMTQYDVLDERGEPFPGVVDVKPLLGRFPRSPRGESFGNREGPLGVCSRVRPGTPLMGRSWAVSHLAHCFPRVTHAHVGG